tara:strand:+ start:471 stop:1220 length:750 start_codon:yes stop_codon:yes gene_type:complete
MENYKKILLEQGFVVYKNAININTCCEFINNVNDPNTHWNIRKLLKPIFSNIWLTDNLLTSFDGIGVRDFGENDDGLDWHVDQNLSRAQNEMVGIQAILALSKVNSKTGGTQFLPGSHKHHESLVLRNDNDPYNDNTWEFVHVEDDDIIFDSCAKPVFPKLNIGDLLIWDSRTLHKVLSPKDWKNTNRIACYISMLPKKNSTNEILKLRKDAFYKGLYTTHWCDRCIIRGEDQIFELPIVDDDLLKMIC